MHERKYNGIREESSSSTLNSKFGPDFHGKDSNEDICHHKDAVFKQSNANLTYEQRKLLLWHYRLGHINIKHVQSLLQKPCSGESRIIIPSNNKCSHTHQLMCAVCQYAK